MKAIVVTEQAAGTAGMKLVERPEPQPAINDVVVQIHASGFVPTEMEWPSTWTVRRDRDRTPSIPGHELAGVVTALGCGTPGISDPGARLIRECIKRGLDFTIIPGPSSILTALVGSGFSAEKFFFGGFLPITSGQRERELRAAAQRGETSIFFESPYRLIKTLKASIDILQDRQVCVARELTKKFEEFRRGAAAELLAHYEKHPPKGEIVLLVSPLED